MPAAPSPGLDLGDAVVMRNIGGRITPEVLRSWQLLAKLGQKEGGGQTAGGPPHLVVLHHADCGIIRLAANPERLARADPARPRLRASLDRGGSRYCVSARPPAWSLKAGSRKNDRVSRERGYLIGAVDQRDPRRRRFTVTDHGHSLMTTGEQVFDELRDRWAQRIGITELERLEEALADLGIRIPTRFDAPGWFAGSSPE
jgi:hypothetical protein